MIRFSMRKCLFMRLVGDMEINYPYFQTTWDAKNQRSFSALQKCTSAHENFCYGVAQMYKAEYFCCLTSIDIQLLYEAYGVRHGFPEMLGSVDCTHWNLRDCLTELRGQYMTGDHQYPSMILEAEMSQDLWFWHALYGVANSNNDLHVLYYSPLLMKTIMERDLIVLNDEQYIHVYYLVDGIYLSWVVFVKLHLTLVCKLLKE
uniref:Uncharacterized protein n=1 Tax=Lactuca sativa TaxID=4236 RepID=A0A9R1WTW6_LACSA|nr:hypothetical protein LSAT_V11C900473280 [Lactuca sativa]